MKLRILMFFVAILLVSMNSNSLSQGNWQQIEGPYGGVVQCIAAEDNMYFAGTLNGGLYRSTDYGTNWSLVGQDLPFNDIDELLINNHRLFVVNRLNGIYISDDFGLTWTIGNNGFNNFNITEIIALEGKLYLSINSLGVYLSTNNGDSWVPKNIGLNNLVVNHISSFGTALFAATNQGIYVSGNYGDSWGTLKPTGAYNYIVSNGSHIFIASNYSINMTSNNGLDWVTASASGVGTGQIYSLISTGNYIMVGRSSGMYVSSFLGGNWVNIHTSLSSYRVYYLKRVNDYLYSGTSKGVFFSQDFGGSWKESNNGIKNERITTMLVEKNNHYVGLYDNGLVKSTDQGKTWEDMNLGKVNIKLIVKEANHIFVITNNKVMHSETEGIIWDERIIGIEGMTLNNLYYHKGILYLGTNNGLFYSDNLGIKWKEKSDFLEPFQIRGMYIDKNDDIYLATNDKIIFSRDKGSNWQSSSLGMKSYNLTYIHGFGDTLIVGSYPQTSFEADIYVSTDQARNWVSSSLDLTDNYIANIQNYNDILFITARGIGGAESKGILFSSNMGKSWREFNHTLLTTDVPSLKVFGDNIFAGTFGAGLYKNSIPEKLYIPQPIYPTHLQKNVVLSTKLDFSDIENADSYIVQLSETEDFKAKTIVINDTIDISEYQIVADTLEFNTLYFWRVSQISNGNISDWSDVFEFTTEKDIITKTNLSSPADKSTDLWVETEFTWESLTDADEYMIQISDVNDFSNIVYELAVAVNNLSIANDKLEFEKEYFWRVSAKIHDVYREWSESFSFTTMTLNLTKPALKTVVDNSDGTMISVILAWDTVQFADSYQVQIAKDDQFSGIVYDELLSNTEVELSRTNLDFSTDYFWKVKAKFIENESEWSDASTFKTVQEVSVYDMLDKDITIYPNPVYNTLNIKLENPTLDFYSIKIINQLGNLVFEQNFVNNNSDLSLNIPDNLSSGIYYIKINNIYKKLSIIR